MAYYICKHDGVFVEWIGLSMYLTQNNPAGLDIKSFLFNCFPSMVDITFKEFDEINNEIGIDLLPLVDMLISVLTLANNYHNY